MSASLESASNSAPAKGGRAPRFLTVAPSWLGDGVMAMPALLALRAHAPHAHITVLSKRGVADLWRLFKSIDEVSILATDGRGTFDTIGRVRDGRFDCAYILPRSFRSAVIPFCARVPERRGLAGHARNWMLTETVRCPSALAGAHQWQEYLQVFGLAGASAPLPPFLAVPEEQMEQARRRVVLAWQGRAGVPESPLVAGFFPGAARGPAKRWPSEAFVDLGRRLLASQACRILVLGGRQDRAVCGQVAEGIGRGAVNTAGETPLALLAGFLRLCRVVVANDSGGMHLAAAVGARVVGLFGATDPSKTAPLGAGHRVIAARGVAHSRAVPRDADWARKAMASITVDEVYTAAVDVLEDWRPLSARQASGRAPPQG